MKVYEIEIELIDVQPRVWRKVIIEEAANLFTLHLTIQGAMGWLNYHLHKFEINGNVYEATTDSMDFVSDVLKNGMTFTYCYDFGDNWLHKLTVTNVREQTQYDTYQKCIGGQRACPPEDSGGVHGYAKLLKILKNKTHPEYKSMKQWAGAFHPEVFSATQASALISALLALS